MCSLVKKPGAQLCLSKRASLIAAMTPGQVCSVPSMRPLVLSIRGVGGGVCVCECAVHSESLKERAFKVRPA